VTWQKDTWQVSCGSTIQQISGCSCRQGYHGTSHR